MVTTVRIAAAAKIIRLYSSGGASMHPPSNTRFLAHVRLSHNGILIGSAVLQCSPLASLPNRQTDGGREG